MLEVPELPALGDEKMRYSHGNTVNTSVLPAMASKISKVSSFSSSGISIEFGPHDTPLMRTRLCLPTFVGSLIPILHQILQNQPDFLVKISLQQLGGNFA
jgi:hypothetical protein